MMLDTVFTAVIFLNAIVQVLIIGVTETDAQFTLVTLSHIRNSFLFFFYTVPENLIFPHTVHQFILCVTLFLFDF